MNLSQSRLKFRQRTPWEATDLGRRLVRSQLGYYAGLQGALMLPIVILGAVLFWNQPFWFLAWIWWLKPLTEYGILAVLSVHAFTDLPPWRQALKDGYKLMLRPQNIADLTLRRLSLTRSFSLPIRQLEQLSGKNYRNRQRELGRYGNTAATTLTFFGNALESLWLYATITLAYWFLYGNFIEQGLVQPSQMDNIQQIYSALIQSWADPNNDNFMTHAPWAYWLTLCFWAPFYVGSGFTLYLNARVHIEAWDIRLLWQQLRERVRGKANWYLSVLLAIGISAMPLEPSYAETLPDAEQIQQQRQEVLNQAPFYHVAEKETWCWLSCDDSPQQNANPAPSNNNPSVLNSGFIQLLAYALLAGLLGAVIYLLYRNWQQRGLDNAQPNEMPTHLFGFDLRHDALPKNVSQQALNLLKTDPRAALSLLYRASLSQLVHQQHLPIKEHHTEGQVLQLVGQKMPTLNPFFQPLTQAWLHTAYGHHLSEAQEIEYLCQQYAHHFEARQAS